MRTFNEIIQAITELNTYVKSEQQLNDIHTLAWELQLKCEHHLSQIKGEE